MTLREFVAVDKEALARSLWRAHGRDTQARAVAPPRALCARMSKAGRTHRSVGWGCAGQVLPLLINLMADFEVRDAALWQHVLARLQQAGQFAAMLDGLARLSALAAPGAVAVAAVAAGALAGASEVGGDAAAAGVGSLLSLAEGPALWQAALEGLAETIVRAGACVSPPLASDRLTDEQAGE
jgi:hypothetical protein